MKKKKKPWMRFRHRVVTAFVRPFFAVFVRLKYHIKIDRFKEQGKRNWLVLSNHQTDFDQFFVGLAFKRQIYYMAMEDLFSNGWISKLIRFIVAPIPFMKATADVKSVMTCIKIAREGGTIAIFPEGNRTYSGKTCYIKPAIAAMAKKLGLPIALFRIEGGYGVKPRWSDKCRKGKMKAGVRRVIEPEEYADMSKEELYELICKELWVDECTDTAEFTSDVAAEHLERVLYVCPDCGLSEFDSKNEFVFCKQCKKIYYYDQHKQLLPVRGKGHFRTIADWYDYQESFIRSLDLTPYMQSPVFSDTANVSEVIVYDRKRPTLKGAKIRMFADRLVFGEGESEQSLPFDEIKAMACIAGHKLNVFYQDTIYQLKGDKHFNALKYCNIYYHAKFVKEGQPDGEFQFLGL
ncbi:MAG: 1-acyl-sn-glycerol-3-phosphate acyltransferase [Clostridia bacterium]|nr:1-acyl-sn-glycerol-3-phosphate acyltransferase [Clostridia bacterium]